MLIFENYSMNPTNLESETLYLPRETNKSLLEPYFSPNGGGILLLATRESRRDGILIPKYSESWNKFRELGGFDY